MATKEALARRLRAARVERGLTQAEVGRALGLHRPAITEIEAGRRFVTVDELSGWAGPSWTSSARSA